MSHLQDIAVRFQVQLEQLKAATAKDYNRLLAGLVALVEGELGSREIAEISRAKVEELIRGIVRVHKVDAKASLDTLLDSLKDLATYSYEFEAGSIVAGTTVEALDGNIGRSLIWETVLARPLSSGGDLMLPWLNQMSTSQVTATENLLRRAHSEGWTSRQMLQTFRGTRANRFTDGIVPMLGRANETIIHTGIQHVNSVGRLRVWQDNADIVKGYRWVSTLDGKTSDECRGLDGEEFEVGAGPLPPIHRRCRSTTVAVIDKVFAMLERGGTRASATGPVPVKQTYYEWLSDQPAEFQDEVLGTSRGRLLRNGGLTTEEFTRLQLNRSFQPLTLKQMRRLKPLAFQRAGI